MIKKKFFKTNSECEVSFEFTPEAGTRVSLVCDANGWEPVEMKRSKSGRFCAKLRVPKASVIQFRYLVDGTRWYTDEEADGTRMNQFGGQNSIIES